MKSFTEKINESTTERVFIEPVASASDFSKFINNNGDELDFDSEEFWDNMGMFDEGTLSGRFDKDWCNKVISGQAGDYWKDKAEYYPAILKLLIDYDLETIRFACDW
jgi:hypothetical protein